MKFKIETTLVAAALVVGTAACGGGSGAAKPTETALAAAPQTVAALTILLRPSRSTEVDSAAQSALVSAGYTIVVDKNAAHDAEGQLTATETEAASFFQVQVNGQRQPTYHVHVALALESEGQIIDQVTADFDAKKTEITSDKFNGLVSALGSSPRVQKFAADRATIAQQKVTDAAAADAAWANTIGDCGAPKDSHSCDSLNAWFASDNRRPAYGGDMPLAERRKLAQGAAADRRAGHGAVASSHHEQAAEILAAAAPALQRFADDETWAKIDVASCQNAAISTDCSSVRSYFRQFPSGAHAADAIAAIGQGNQKLAAIDEENNRKADAQQRVITGRAQQDQCKSKCSSETCIAYTETKANAQCISQCVAGCS